MKTDLIYLFYFDAATRRLAATVGDYSSSDFGGQLCAGKIGYRVSLVRRGRFERGDRRPQLQFGGSELLGRTAVDQRRVGHRL